MDDSTMTALRSALIRAVFFAVAAIGFSLALVPLIAASHGTGVRADASDKISITNSR